MKVVAVFVVACIAVALAYPYNDQKMEIRRGNPVVYNQALDKWEEQTSQIQEECDTGAGIYNCYFIIIIGFLRIPGTVYMKYFRWINISPNPATQLYILDDYSSFPMHDKGCHILYIKYYYIMQSLTHAGRDKS